MGQEASATRLPSCDSFSTTKEKDQNDVQKMLTTPPSWRLEEHHKSHTFSQLSIQFGNGWLNVLPALRSLLPPSNLAHFSRVSTKSKNPATPACRLDHGPGMCQSLGELLLQQYEVVSQAYSRFNHDTQIQQGIQIISWLKDCALRG